MKIRNFGTHFDWDLILFSSQDKTRQGVFIFRLSESKPYGETLIFRKFMEIIKTKKVS